MSEENTRTERIEVTAEEAMRIAAHLKMGAQKLQIVAELLRQQGPNPNISELEEHSASLDDFADKLYRPFVGQEGIDDTMGQVERAARQMLGEND